MLLVMQFDKSFHLIIRGRGDSVVERRTPEREVLGSNPTTAM